MDFLKDIFYGLINLGIFMNFGLPVIIGVIAFFIGGFSEGGIFSFRERISRKSYIKRLLISMGLLFVSMGLIAFAANLHSTYLLIPGICLFVGLLLYSIANQVKRLHDMEQSGWWILAFYVITYLAKQSPETDLIFTSGTHIVLSAIKGTVGPNKYGDDPLKNNNDYQNLDYVNGENNRL